MYDDVVKYSLRLPGMVVLLHNKDLCGAGHGQSQRFLRDQTARIRTRWVPNKFLILCMSYLVLPPFQIIRRFGFSRYITLIMHLDIVYI